MGRFRRSGAEELYRGRLVRVARVEVVAPDGSTHQREVVRHPGAVGVVPLHADGSVTLVTQYRAALDAELVEIPAGLRDVAGEAAEQTARRELAEEAGLAAGNLEHLLTFHNSPGFADEAVSLYLATDLREVPHARQSAEEHHMTVAALPLDEAVAMVAAGRITDAKTVIGLLYVAGRRG